MPTDCTCEALMHESTCGYDGPPVRPGRATPMSDDARLLSAEVLREYREVAIDLGGLSDSDVVAILDHVDALAERLEAAEARASEASWMAFRAR